MVVIFNTHFILLFHLLINLGHFYSNLTGVLIFQEGYYNPSADNPIGFRIVSHKLQFSQLYPQ